MDLPHRAARGALVVTLLLGLLAGCAAGRDPGPAGPSGVPPHGPSAESPAASQAPAAASLTPGPTGTATAGALEPTVPTACLTLGEADCVRARTFAATTLAGGDPAVVYVQVGPFGCAAGDACATTLVARPEGDVTLEFADATSANVHLIVAPDGTWETTREPGFGIAVAPSSPAGLQLGRMAFTLGHCGVFSGIDLDGSWWDAVGPVAMDDGEAVNPTAGVIAFSDADHATFLAPGGLTLQLIRRDGVKVLPPCM